MAIKMDKLAKMNQLDVAGAEEEQKNEAKPDEQSQESNANAEERAATNVDEVQKPKILGRFVRRH